MAAETKIVLDANILIRAVLGKKVRNTIEILKMNRREESLSAI